MAAVHCPACTRTQHTRLLSRCSLCAARGSLLPAAPLTQPPRRAAPLPLSRGSVHKLCRALAEAGARNVPEDGHHHGQHLRRPHPAPAGAVHGAGRSLGLAARARTARPFGTMLSGQRGGAGWARGGSGETQRGGAPLKPRPPPRLPHRRAAVQEGGPRPPAVGAAAQRPHGLRAQPAAADVAQPLPSQGAPRACARLPVCALTLNNSRGLTSLHPSCYPLTPARWQ